MSVLRTLFAPREAKAAFVVWALVPTLFLFFTITLAVDPTTQLNKVRLGVTVLDTGADTPQGHVALGSQLVAGMHQQLPIEIVPFSSASDLRDAVLAHNVAGGIVFPANMTQNLLAKQPVALQIVKSDANDPFTNAFITNLSSQLSTNLNTELPLLLAGGPSASQPAPPLVAVTNDVVAATHDFRFATIPATLVLPLWLATVAFATLLTRAGDHVRRTVGGGALETGLIELAASAGGAAITAAVITLDIALFTWRGDLDFVGLFGFLWLGLIAAVWLVQGTLRLLGLGLGVPLGVLALFIQQPVSGAAFPPAFAPDVVRWAADVAPLRYLIEGVRNLLIGGSTTGTMAVALAGLAGLGLLLFAAGQARRALIPIRQRPPQPAASA